MKVKTPEIHWHSKSSIFSLDYSVKGKLATAGADFNVNLWSINFKKNEPKYLSSLTRHDSSVNIVRFSPDGDTIASGSDDNKIILWRQNESWTKKDAKNSDEEYFKELWVPFKILEGHTLSVFGISWHNNNRNFFSVSMDSNVVIWDILKEPKNEVESKKIHKDFIQGCSFDPLGSYIITQCDSGSTKITAIENSSDKLSFGKVKVLNKIKFKEDEDRKEIFHDQETETYFRRPDFTPDGTFFILPCGKPEDDSRASENSVYVFNRNCLSRPVLSICGLPKAVSAVRCCGKKFPLRAPSIHGVESRYVFALLAGDSVIICDTESMNPLGFVTGIHYRDLLDCCWDAEGSNLFVCSADGFVTIIHFEEGEL